MLGNVISKLAEGRALDHIPFRNSKLTRILQPSLGEPSGCGKAPVTASILARNGSDPPPLDPGGNARTAVIATINPGTAHADETSHTLRFASRAMTIVNTVQVNEVLSDVELIQRYKARALRPLLSSPRAGDRNRCLLVVSAPFPHPGADRCKWRRCPRGSAKWRAGIHKRRCVISAGDAPSSRTRTSSWSGSWSMCPTTPQSSEMAVAAWALPPRGPPQTSISPLCSRGEEPRRSPTRSRWVEAGIKPFCKLGNTERRKSRDGHGDGSVSRPCLQGTWSFGGGKLQVAAHQMSTEVVSPGGTAAACLSDGGGCLPASDLLP